jgi:hypothetical protein
MSRQESRIRKGTPSPPFKETLLGDAFRMCNIPVLYSFNSDNDDSLAAHAQRDSASILSEDQDYFRYKNTTFTIYKNFTESKKSLVLSLENDKRDIKKV